MSTHFMILHYLNQKNDIISGFNGFNSTSKVIIDRVNNSYSKIDKLIRLIQILVSPLAYNVVVIFL